MVLAVKQATVTFYLSARHHWCICSRNTIHNPTAAARNSRLHFPELWPPTVLTQTQLIIRFVELWELLWEAGQPGRLTQSSTGWSLELLTLSSAIGECIAQGDTLNICCRHALASGRWIMGCSQLQLPLRCCCNASTRQLRQKINILGRLFDRVIVFIILSSVRPSVRAYVRPSTKSLFSFNDIWHVRRTS